MGVLKPMRDRNEGTYLGKGRHRVTMTMTMTTSAVVVQKVAEDKISYDLSRQVRNNIKNTTQEGILGAIRTT